MKRSLHHMSFLFPLFQRINIIIEVSTKKHPKQQVTTKLGCCKSSQHCSIPGKAHIERNSPKGQFLTSFFAKVVNLASNVRLEPITVRECSSLFHVMRLYLNSVLSWIQSEYHCRPYSWHPYQIILCAKAFTEPKLLFSCWKSATFYHKYTFSKFLRNRWHVNLSVIVFVD